MKDTIRKFTILGGLVVGRCAGTFYVAKVCKLLPQYRRFFGCDPDSKFIALSLPQLALVFALQVLNMESNITRDNFVQQAASTFVKSMEKLDLERCIDV